MDFPSQEISALENRANFGETARGIMNSEQWSWIKQFLLGAMEDEAIQILKTAKTNEERLEAQLMFLAAQKPEKQLSFLVSQGDAARAALAEIETERQQLSTLEGQERGE